MARPVEYDLENVLDRAMEIFWQKGYEAVSMAELVSHTGLNRGTMYSLFKDKEGLFKDALNNYYKRRASNQVSILKDNPGKKGIELFFRNFAFSENYKGCLFSNTMCEKDFLDTQAYEIPEEFFKKILMQLELNLQQAKEMDEFSSDERAMSLTIITMVHGFHVHGKYNSSKKDGEIIIKNILNMIR